VIVGHHIRAALSIGDGRSIVIEQLPEDHGRLKNFSMLLTCECQGKVYGRICNSNGYLRDNFLT
jgi:hypothetical protein